MGRHLSHYDVNVMVIYDILGYVIQCIQMFSIIRDLNALDGVLASYMELISRMGFLAPFAPDAVSKLSVMTVAHLNQNKL